MNITVTYTNGRILYFNVYSLDNLNLWNGTALIAKASVTATQAKIPLSDSANQGIYSGIFPVLIPYNTYLVIVREQVGGAPNFADDYEVAASSVIWNGSDTESIITVPVVSLASVESANNFFSQRLHSTSWFNATNNQRQLALNEATLILNRFNYTGVKLLSTQANEWPRALCDGTTTTPNEILYALYLIAYALLDGFDPERELRGTRVTSRGYSSVRTTYDTTDTPLHITYGVPSAMAWLYLEPFLNRSGSVKIHRV